jgi:hypothetical protein
MDIDDVLTGVVVLVFFLGFLFIAVVMTVKVMRDFSEGRTRPHGFEALPGEGRGDR